MASRRLTELEQGTYELAEQAMLAWEAAGINILVTCTYRSYEEQHALYVQGRDRLPVVNRIRVDAGMPKIQEAENRIVTRARGGMSWHNWRRAFDVVPLNAGKPVWDDKAAIWENVGKIGESCGLEWAGRWNRNREFPHFQFTDGLNINDMGTVK